MLPGRDQTTVTEKRQQHGNKTVQQQQHAAVSFKMPFFRENAPLHETCTFFSLMIFFSSSYTLPFLVMMARHVHSTAHAYIRMP